MKASLMTKALHHLKNNVIAYLALFVALGGTGYAAVSIPKGSVGTNQLKNHSVTPIKFDKSSIAGYVRDYIQISAQGQILGSRPGASLVGWQTTAPFPGGLIQWNQPIPPSCFAIATTEIQNEESYASAQLASTGTKKNAGTYVRLSAPGTAVSVVIVCPQS